MVPCLEAGRRRDAAFTILIASFLNCGLSLVEDEVFRTFLVIVLIEVAVSVSDDGASPH
jgi:hypothetical protein